MGTKKNEYCTLYVIRHGETQWNVAGRLQGHSDSALTDTGIAQAKARAAELVDVSFDAVFSSDSSRAHQTAEILKLDRELVVQTSELLRELSFGSYEGKLAADMRAALKEKLAYMEQLPDVEQWDFKLAEDIETENELMSRFLLKLREISVAYIGKTVLVVTHGACLRSFLLKLGYATRAQLSFTAIANTAYVQVDSDGINFIVKETKGVTLQ